MYFNRPIRSVVTFAFITAVLSFMPFLTPGSLSQECAVLICKETTETGDGLVFPFLVKQGNTTQQLEIESNGPCFLLGFGLQESLTVVEAPFPGWELEQISCTITPEISVDFNPEGVVLDCLAPISNAITCNFFNIEGTAETPIPTLSEWGMIAAAAGLGLVGVFFAVRRRRAFNS
jgi:hypothetical protein